MTPSRTVDSAPAPTRREPWEATRQRLLGALVEAGPGAVSSEDLSRRLGVSTRSIRTYVSRLNGEHETEVVSSSRAGYTLDHARLASAGAGTERPDPGRRVLSPGERLSALLRSIVTADDGADVFELAEDLRVSDSTLEADLTKGRALLAIHHLRLERSGPRVRIVGPELAKRRLVRQIMTDAARSRTQFVSVRELAIESAEPSLMGFREGLTRILRDLGLLATENNQHAILAHVAVMVGRIRQGHQFDPPDAASTGDDLRRDAARRIAELIETTFELRLPAGEEDYLVGLLDENTTPEDLSLVVAGRLAPRERISGVRAGGSGAVGAPDAADGPDAAGWSDGAGDEVDFVAVVRRIVAQVGENYLIDLDNERFIAFLSLHARNLVRRARRRQSAHIPGGQSIKDTHPLIYEVGIFIARRLELALGVEIRADEIGLISFHVGAHFQSVYARERLVRIAMISPTYLDLQDSARSLLQSAIAGVGEIETIAFDEAEIATGPSAPDLIVSTVPLQGLQRELASPVLHLSALPGAQDLEQVRRSVLEIAAEKRRSRVGASLVNLIEPQLFLGLEATTREDTIAQMCAALGEAGMVEPGFHRGVLEREEMSSTSLGTGVAIPHSMVIDAHTSSIAVYVPKKPIVWGEDEVSIVAMMAFSKDSREEFGELFEALIRVLSKRENVERLAGRAGTYEEFIRGLLEVI
ncbi:PTS sugar transporter subunit IIA [Brachybacterium sp. MASK1Z-5]|uniref:PTS sugar transporter subunit IIA n=1 Tax=Brachybacterium halotolerans TaxID=2795215 RepID=A0ABS1BAA0_9MICO|nr:PTS sugar transporter subunit IIA [Brachybacterium halotolerans]MBK0331544.1 PTS sugar transporter subunit IIA [Brachybacterium halotolerans]